MHKCAVFLIPSLLATPFTYAENLENNWSIGINAAYFNQGLSINNAKNGTSMSDVKGGPMADHLDSGKAMEISISKKINNNFRLSLGFNFNNEEKSSFNANQSNSGSIQNHLSYGLEQQQIRLSGDYLIPLSNNTLTNAYIGLHAGISNINYSFERKYFLGSDNHYGAKGKDISWMAGLQAGIEHYFHPNISAEAGLLYSRYGHDFTADSPTVVDYLPQLHQIKLKSQISGFIGIKFHF